MTNFYFGLIIFFGITILKYSFSVINPLLIASVLSVVPFFNAFAILAALSYPILGAKAVTTLKNFLNHLLFFFYLLLFLLHKILQNYLNYQIINQLIEEYCGQLKV